MNEFALECKYKYNCNYCSTKSSLPNLQENGVTSIWMNLILNVNLINNLKYISNSRTKHEGLDC